MRDRVRVYEHLMREAFEAGEWGSLLGNLASVPAEAWEWVPDGGARSIRSIVWHVGVCKAMYANHAFGDASLRWEDPFITDTTETIDHDRAVAWLRRMHRMLTEAVAGLDDHDLERLVLTNWGSQAPVTYILDCMIHHDVYHAGEINLLRSLHARNDGWAYGHDAL